MAVARGGHNARQQNVNRTHKVAVCADAHVKSCHRVLMVDAQLVNLSGQPPHIAGVTIYTLVRSGVRVMRVAISAH